MSAPTLTIRNLTRTPLELKVLGRLKPGESPNDVSFKNVSNVTDITNLTKSFTGLGKRNVPPSEVYSTEDVSITVASFESKATNIQPKEREALQLTFEVQGERYQVQVPSPSDRSTVLTPQSANAHLEFTAVYLPRTSHLAIFSSAKLDSWMSQLKDTTPLSALSIPGTHNSTTHYKALPSVRCQSVSVQEQLDNGVRFLDLRLQPESPQDASKDALVLVHSAFPISLTGNKYFRDLIKTVTAFLDAHPSETVIMSLKREGTGTATDHQLARILHDHYATDAGRWFTENRIPTLGEARRKMVIVRRFGIDDALRAVSPTGWCIDAESWPDNCADGTCSSGEIRVQDFYEVAESENIDRKIVLSTDHLMRAAQAVCLLPGGVAADDPAAATVTAATATAAAARQPFFINFLSASNFFRPACWPDKIAAKVNPRVVDFLCRKHNETEAGPGGTGPMSVGDGGTGIVVCDWVGHEGDWDLVRCIVGMNAKLMEKAAAT